MRALVAAVHQRDAVGDRLEVQRPVERAVAATDDQDVAAPEHLHLAHGVEDGRALIGLDAGDRRFLGLERAAAGRDDHALGLEHGAGVGGQAEARSLGRADRLERLDHLVEVEGRAEGLDLLDQVVDQTLAGDDRKTRNVVDRLFGIKLGALPADLGQDVDEMGLDVEQPELEHRKQPARTRPDDHDVGGDHLTGCSLDAHLISFEPFQKSGKPDIAARHMRVRAASGKS